jgi:hypothetical protein
MATSRSRGGHVVDDLARDPQLAAVDGQALPVQRAPRTGRVLHV